MVGPCLCGDPYCGSCGDPSLAILEEAEIKLADTMNEHKATIEHYDMVIKLVPILIRVVDEVVNERVKESRVADQEYIDYLKARLIGLERR
jgi:hypothetical protein